MEKIVEITITTPNKRLDEIVFERYGDLNLFDKIVALNADLMDGDVFLRQGQTVRLLEVQREVKYNIVEGAKLW